MSKQQNTIQTDQEANYDFRLPLITAADAGRGHRSRVYFSEYQADIFADIAHQRAPANSPVEDRTMRNHLLGVSTEVAVATWCDGWINKQIYEQGGDGGIDVTAPSKWGTGFDNYQVKATRDMENPERIVTEAELEAADYFVLCCTTAPRSFAEIVGYTNCEILKKVGKTYGKNGYLLSPQILTPLLGKIFPPNDVRDAALR